MPASPVLQEVLAWIGTYLVHSTLLLGGAWLITRRLPNLAPRLQERVWRLAMLGGLVTASVQVLGGTHPSWGTWNLKGEQAPEAVHALSKLDWVQSIPKKDALHEAAPETHSWPSPAAATSMDPSWTLRRSEKYPSQGFRASRKLPGPLGPRTTEPGSPASGATLESTLPHAVTPERRLPQRAGDLPGISLANALVGLCALILVVGLLGFLWACSTLIARLSRRQRITGGPLRRQLDSLTESAGMGRRVQLFTSPAIESPIAYGWLRPRIGLPIRALTDLSTTQQRSMLAHELAHVMRADPLWFSLYTLVVRLFAFQPLNRLARRELLENAELLADDWAVRWTGQRLALASCLTEVAQWILAEQRPLAITAGMADRPSRLGVRVERLLQDCEPPAAEPKHRWWTPAALSMLALCTAAAPGFSAVEVSQTPLEPQPATGEASARPSETAPKSLPLKPQPAPAQVPHSLLELPALAAPAPTRAPTPAALPNAAVLLQLEFEELDQELSELQATASSLRKRFNNSKRTQAQEELLSLAEASLQRLRKQEARLRALLR